MSRPSSYSPIATELPPAPEVVTALVSTVTSWRQALDLTFHQGIAFGLRKTRVKFIGMFLVDEPYFCLLQPSRRSYRQEE